MSMQIVVAQVHELLKRVAELEKAAAKKAEAKTESTEKKPRR